MSTSDPIGPATNPHPGDEIRSAPWKYKVASNDGWRVTYEIYHDAWGWICSRTVTPETWRAMAAGFTAPTAKKS